MKRRTFLRNIGGTAVALGGGVLGGEAWGFNEYPYSSMEDAFEAAGFDAGAPGAFTTVWTADVHYGIGEPNTILPAVHRAIEAMPVRPAFLAIAGDLVCTASLSFGHVPNAKERDTALDELRALKAHVDEIEGTLPVKLALGNHDTHPEEDAPALFHAVFPERPEYHAFTEQGVPFIFLNGGSSGNLDAEQRAWFRREVENRFDPEASLMTVCHQPSLGRVTNERGVTQAYREALHDKDGDVWMVAGHHHKNEDRRFALPAGTIVQATITTSNPTVWGTEKPGYWVYAFRNRRLVARIFHRIGAGYAVAPEVSMSNPEPVRLPFEDTPTLWQVLVGEGDEPYRVKTEAQWCQNYWYYNRELIYRLPFVNGARHVAILNTPESDKAPDYGVSADGTMWQVPAAPETQGTMTVLPISDAMKDSNAVYVRLRHCTVSGFALLA